MSLTKIDDIAKPKLDALSAWVSKTDDFMKVQENLFRCSDEGRHVKVDPLLEKLRFKVKGYGYSIWRITGKITFKPTPDYESLFFPLSIKPEPDGTAGVVQAAGEVLTPGSYISFTKLLNLDGELDCLIVYIPKSGELSAAEQ